MNTTENNLLDRLHILLGVHGTPRRMLVMLSGGRDSTVLLHALATEFSGRDTKLAAVHVNHHLHANADDWQAHCAALCQALGVELHCLQVTLPARPPGGLEAGARDARYRAARRLLAGGDWLLSAHHEDDQAETLLLNLMRGSGPAGLAGIGEVQPIGDATLVRPFRDVSAARIAAYAERHVLQWIDDPANEERRFDRNFLRHDILPLLAARWPAVTRQLARSAALAGESATLLQELAAMDVAQAGTPARLSIERLRALPAPRQSNLLRHAARQLGLPPLPQRTLAQIQDTFFDARDDAMPFVSWSGGEARRYRDHAYLLAAAPAEVTAPGAPLVPGQPLDLGAGQGALWLLTDQAGGIRPDVAAAGLTVRYRQGGEKIRAAGQECTRSLKKLMQASSIVPWMRARVPLVYAGNTLVAVADLWVAESAHSADGHALRWADRPALF